MIFLAFYTRDLSNKMFGNILALYIILVLYLSNVYTVSSERRTIDDANVIALISYLYIISIR